MNRWGLLSKPVDPLEETRIAIAMSALTRNGVVPTYDQARQYALQQTAPDPDYYLEHSYEELSQGW